MDRNILLVSEQDQKAYLPYKFEDVENILKNSNNKFNSTQDVIKSLYILPLYSISSILFLSKESIYLLDISAFSTSLKCFAISKP